MATDPDTGSTQRKAGVLLHPSSLPGRSMLGTLGKQAHTFVDQLASAGVTLWQTLPLGPVHEDLSPYMSLSAHAGNPLLIDLDWLQRRGWLAQVPGIDSFHAHIHHVREAWPGFQWHASQEEQDDYRSYLAKHAAWLDDYALYLALHEHFHEVIWTEWPPALRDRDPAALAAARDEFRETIDRICFEQYVFYCQWHELRGHATSRGIQLVGDMPIFVAHDSADVWAHRENFNLDEQGWPRVVAGVPPDYFSDTGQLWGNPHFDWDYMIADGFSWWTDRVRSNLELFDIVRVDHFRGFEAVWQIPAESETAIDGQWVKVPGEKLFDHLIASFGRLPFIAEDLGIITPEVEALRDRYHLPGMKILQFAFGGDDSNPYLPGNYQPHCIVYTGTHDNDTTLGWYASLDGAERRAVKRYIGDDSDMPWPMIEIALSSAAEIAVIPLQDILALGSEARMNVPGKTEGNWRWRYSAEQLTDKELARLAGLIRQSGRGTPGL